MKIMRSLLSFTLACSLLFLSINAAFASIPIPEPPKGGEGEENENPLDKLKMLQPIQNLVSGSVGMIAKGIDNRALIEGERFNTPDGPNFSSVESPLNVGRSSPMLQGGAPGVLVPYRDHHPHLVAHCWSHAISVSARCRLNPQLWLTRKIPTTWCWVRLIITFLATVSM